jgi:uncharacterized protein YndB with AHSA1/START domain
MQAAGGNAMIKNEAKVEIPRSASEVFKMVTDPASAPRYLSGCVELRREGELRSGAPLHYTTKQGGRTVEMDGTITAVDKDRKLTMQFGDRAFEVVVDFTLAPVNGHTRLDHSISITPRGLVGRLMVKLPAVKTGNQKQVQETVTRLLTLMADGASRT